MKGTCTIIYRGPLERARLSYIIETLALMHRSMNFIWIFPGKLTQQRKDFSVAFLDQYAFADVTILEHRWRDIFRSRKVIQSKIRTYRPGVIALVGFSSLVFGSEFDKAKRVWFINGIPEEKSLHNSKAVTRLTGWLQWQIQLRAARMPDLIVTVSNRMKRMVSAKVSGVPVFTAPTCVDIGTFRMPHSAIERKYFTYLGSGAPWQALDLLSAVWQNIHKLDESIHFRVISRDARCRILATGISPDRIEFVQSNDFRQVALFINESIAGFLLRKDDIVNRVSFPTKLAEYLASGCWVVTTDLDWDISDYFKQYQIGIRVSVDDSPGKMAAAIIQFKNKLSPAVVSKDITRCADTLDRNYWKELLKEELTKLSK